MSGSEPKEPRIKSKFSIGLGVQMIDVSPGYASLELEVEEGILNAFNTVHGGAIFTLADTAFGIAGNTRGMAVGLQASIHFLKPAFLGDKLVATAVEESLSRTTGVYNVRVENQKGELVALFRGVTYRKNQDHKG